MVYFDQILEHNNRDVLTVVIYVVSKEHTLRLAFPIRKKWPVKGRLYHFSTAIIQDIYVYQLASASYGTVYARPYDGGKNVTVLVFNAVGNSNFIKTDYCMSPRLRLRSFHSYGIRKKGETTFDNTCREQWLGHCYSKSLPCTHAVEVRRRVRLLYSKPVCVRSKTTFTLPKSNTRWQITRAMCGVIRDANYRIPFYSSM